MLTIYSASAGTGKTHTLTGEYMSLLFKGKEKHRHILAVTFTNKATAEMKSRIIDELFRLADRQPSDYIALLSGNGKTSEPEIRNQAQRILRTMLHDYSAFHISTIDRFFQQTLRAFTREIGLQGNYQVELDKDRMIEKSVENMFSDLEKSENKTLLEWLLRFTEDKIDETGRWDIRNDIIKLGGQLFNETYKAYGNQIAEEIEQKHRLSGYREILYRIIQSTRKTAKEMGERGVLLMQQYGMQPADFKNTSRSPFFFFGKLAEGVIEAPSNTFCGLVDNVEGYLSKTATPQLKQTAEQLYADGMNELIRNIVSFFENLTDYYTAFEIARNYNALGVLTELSQHIAEWREENNTLLITDTTELLNKIIDGSEIPFIYEKTGVRIEHYMIDEFQDTSVMQWSNFRPLLKDSLDSGRNNLIVGDVKQSIYRFRNSDWKLLDRQVKIDFKNRTDEKNLTVNWRSYRHIVEFNNMLFDAIPTLLQQAYNEEVEQSSLPADEKERYHTRIVSAYKNAEQQVAPPLKNKEGYVRVQFFTDTGKDGTDEELSWKAQSMLQLPHIVEELQDKGYALRDIAILTRTGAEGALAAQTLLQFKETHPESRYKYDIISEDSLTVGSSLSVRWMIEMLRTLLRPDVKSYREMSQVAYAMLKMKQSKPDDEVLSINRFFQPLQTEVYEKLKQLSYRSLYELAEGLFRLFEPDFPENELVYIQSFFDMITEFSTSETADMGRFLDWWDEKGHGKKIVTPDSQNAIRIMTIHKSKGLGFKVALIPFADWKVDQKESILWCHPTRKPFDTMSLVPVKYGSKLKNTIFASDYFTEKLHAYIDNLNTLYVAFTRAKEALIVMSPQKKTKTATIAGLLWDGLLTDQQFSLDTQNCVYERGEWLHTTATEHPPASLTEIEEWPVERMYSLSPDKRLLLRLYNKGGLCDDGKRKYGLLMHDILSGIEKREDITRVLSEKYGLGEINGEEVTVLNEKLLSLTAENEVHKWFDGSMRTMNETEILYGKGQSLRPDRIMIDANNHVVIVDYKFGEQKEAFYRRQMEEYSALIRAMGYQNVTGYLWYITLHEIENVIF